MIQCCINIRCAVLAVSKPAKCSWCTRAGSGSWLDGHFGCRQTDGHGSSNPSSASNQRPSAWYKVVLISRRSPNKYSTIRKVLGPAGLRQLADRLHQSVQGTSQSRTIVSLAETVKLFPFLYLTTQPNCGSKHRQIQL